jgi:hypothetical protein
MASVLVDSLITRSSTLIQDATNVRWPTAEILGWLNDGQREVVLLRPQASVTNAAFKLAAGTKQSLPDGVAMNGFSNAVLPAGIQLIDITRNMGSSGSAAGRAIRASSREVLDAQTPDWHAKTADATNGVAHFMYDPRDPKTFYVYPQPPQSPAWFVEIAYSSSPTNCTYTGPGDVANKIQIDDIYANALLDYVLYRAYSKDAEYAQNAQLAVAHYTAFQNSLGIKSKTELDQNPNLSPGAFNPNVAGAARQ